VELDLVVGPHRWIRGDSDGDGRASISDAIQMLGHLFLGGPAGCKRAMEVNGDGRIDLSDAAYLLNHLFGGGPPPAAPYPACGVAEDALPCDAPACPA
jgi:hypothetical protein